MIRTPRHHPPRCPPGCACKVCGDHLTTWVGGLSAAPRPGSTWQAVDLNRQPGIAHHQPDTRQWPERLDAFAQDMRALTRWARWGRSNQQGRRT